MIPLLVAALTGLAIVLGAPAVDQAEAKPAPQAGAAQTAISSPVEDTGSAPSGGIGEGEQLAQAAPARPAVFRAVPVTPVSPTPPGRNPPPGATPAPGGVAATAPRPADRQEQPAQKQPMPMSEDVYKQAIYQSEGVYGDLDRPAAGGQIQAAWDISDARDGVYITRMCEDCVYKVRTRQFMDTTLVLPEDAVISGTPDLGDPAGFKIQVRAPNKLVVRPVMYGIDTNLNIYTKSGEVYPFYIRSEGFNSVHIPDVVVKILGRERPIPPPSANENANIGSERQGNGKAKPNGIRAAAVHGLTTPTPDRGDFVRSIPFDPAKLHGWNDYKLWGDDELKPVIVFRDDEFTYIDYGKNWDSVELPTAYVVNDGIDELVNTRVQGSTFIIESVAPLISLKSGKKHLCIQYTGDTP